MSLFQPSDGGPVVETRVQVRYAETDAQRVVYHGNYVVWFEVGRTTYCEHAGYPYPRMEAEGVLIVVTELAARYRRSARYGDVVTIRTRLGEQKTRGCSFQYEVVLPDGSVSAEGETRHLFLDAASGRPCAAPRAIREAFRAFSATGDGAPPEEDRSSPGGCAREAARRRRESCSRSSASSPPRET